ncbi:twin-arginine translocase TatA/TatE family subunit [Flavobacterium pallidum]|uniref:Sec-independent protein translocase protein TatA n=1 Tax=Flavobacterium pallidum TaxID=2172098 RepID=A0A2S1SFA5_9FLAO|nr:twin-arginine translocase TatA/TatE family subunit [Flavobacterium pallidum]AWI25088.1 twin-arginine translocase TatA/TatE family subunit [Flavobacterium pallidum]
MVSSIVFLGEFGGPEVIFVIIIILLLFGGKKIPELMRGLGSGVKEFKNAAKEDTPAQKKPASTDPIAPTSPLTPPPAPQDEEKA